MTCCPKCNVDPYLAASMGDLIPGLAIPGIDWVFPADIDAFKRRLSPDFEATNASVKACTNLDESERAAWADFYGAWKRFEAEETPFWSSWPAKHEQAKHFELRLSEWQKTIAVKCKLVSPVVTPPKTAFDPSVVKWAAGALIALAVAYGVSKVL